MRNSWRVRNMINDVSHVPSSTGIRLKPAVRELLVRCGVLDRIGEQNFHGNVDHAVNAQIAANGDSRADL